MKFLSKRPDLIYWVAMPVLVALGIPLWDDYVYDIQLYDTYYVVDYRRLSILSGFMMLFYGVIYSSSRYAHVRFITTLTVCQMLSTIGGFLMLTILFLWTGVDPGDMSFPTRYYTWTNIDTSNIGYTFIIWIAAAVTAIVVGFLLMILNAVLGFFRRLKVQ